MNSTSDFLADFQRRRPANFKNHRAQLAPKGDLQIRGPIPFHPPSPIFFHNCTHRAGYPFVDPSILPSLGNRRVFRSEFNGRIVNRLLLPRVRLWESSLFSPTLLGETNRIG
ncbi:uncharacterized protein CIMG_12965 [Coccidioides immitis RS]|uniref:Uncharacterized protein n=1 Tax=Coccidioides immitis (strain RS) TaxID=246410 RepID=A0A0D8JTG7_COCIM|nr:uncharacterized protein CIMG_12965 [Coccidioides immitis RS]KJF60429.1 hypothetical protein CIMG_12965 [Coccidioides immitis RS]